jgi:hypothetical protein
MKSKWILVLGFLAAFIGGNAMAQDAETRACQVTAGKGTEVFAKCKAGDILQLGEFTLGITSAVCDFSKQVVLVNNQIAWCVYIGYVRKTIKAD